MVSTSLLSKEFNQFVSVDHFYLDDVCLAHFMALTYRFSTAQIVENTNQTDVVTAFESTWVHHFWNPESIRADQAFAQSDFQKSYKSLKFPLTFSQRTDTTKVQLNQSML